MFASECFEGQVVRLEKPLLPCLPEMVGKRYRVKGVTERGDILVSPEDLPDWTTAIDPRYLAPDFR